MRFCVGAGVALCFLFLHSSLAVNLWSLYPHNTDVFCSQDVHGHNLVEEGRVGTQNLDFLNVSEEMGHYNVSE